VDRRAFALILAVALALVLAAPPTVTAQGADRICQVGLVGPYGPGLDWSILRGYQERLRELGGVEGLSISPSLRQKADQVIE